MKYKIEHKPEAGQKTHMNRKQRRKQAVLDRKLYKELNNILKGKK